MEAGDIGRDAAAAIIAMLDVIGPRADAASLHRAEASLVGSAQGLSMDQIAKLIVRAAADLDPRGAEKRDHDRREVRAVHLYERNGMLHLTATLDPVSAAPVKTAIEAMVAADFRAARERSSADGDDPERRSVPQRQADALALLCTHALSCDHGSLPLQGVTVVVRMTLEQLQTGVGSATIDGIGEPISASTARRMAASAGIIPCVLGARGDVLDWGREKRLFTRAQKLALVERDGGCAMCALPPGMTKAHHLRWWRRDAGPTDLANGVLLCESCHHRIHDNGWEIRVDDADGGRVWFIPPLAVDPDRTPRLGGRARFDYAA